MRSISALVLALVAAAPAAARAAEPAPAAGPVRMSLAEAIAIAQKQSPEVRAAALGIEAAEARVSQAKAQRYPSVSVSGNLLYWNEALSFALAPMMSMTIRDQLTASLTVTAAQPLSPLLVLGELIDLERSGVDAAQADRERARLDAATRAAESYLRVLQARAVRDVSAKGVTQVEANLDRVRKLEQAGIAGDLDVLRLEAARDAVKQGLIRAESGLVIAERALVLALDLPETTRIEAFDDLPETPPRPAIFAELAASMALERRPELRAARERVEQADQGRKIAKAQYLPNVAAIGQYQHNEGQGTFAQKDAWFVGVTLSWTVFEWGRTVAAVDEAAARAQQARIGLEVARDAVAFDARRRADEATTAYESLTSARSALAAAEEAYRLQTIRNEGGEATTTEVLDAETEVARARTGYVMARYDYFLSLVALARAVGDAPAAP
jgi:outer membrane protein TolC